jgi:hypothetical protein
MGVLETPDLKGDFGNPLGCPAARIEGCPGADKVSLHLRALWVIGRHSAEECFECGHPLRAAAGFRLSRRVDPAGRSRCPGEHVAGLSRPLHERAIN